MMLSKTWVVIVFGLFLAVTLHVTHLAAAQTVESETEQAAVDEQLIDEVEARPADYIAWLELSGPLQEGAPRYAWVGENERNVTLRRILSELKKIEENDRFTGLVLYIDQPMMSVTQIQEIDEAVTRVRNAGKVVMAFAESYTLPGYLLACSADKIVLQHKGSVILHGLGVEEMYLAGLLEKVGIKADLIQIGEYKGAGEQLGNTGPSKYWSQNMDKLLDDYYAQIIERISSRRPVNAEEVDKILADSWTMTDEQYVQRKVVDALAERDLVSVTGEVYGDNFIWKKLLGKSESNIQMENPFAMFSMIFKQPKTAIKRPSIALITARGSIHSGESGGGGMFDSESIGSKTFIKALGKAKNNTLIKGVVLRIDSPGGSALASEVIWQAVRDVAKDKPVFISVGRLAASGGYYIACAGDQVFVSPMSIVGSIGVIGGKLTLGGLYEKVGISVYRRTRGPMADLFNSVEPFTEEQRAKLTIAMTNIYDQFTDRVETGRGDKLKNVDLVARGRLFSGRQAVQNGMADKIGGVDVAINAMAAKLDFQDGDYDVINLPQPKSLQEFFDDMFSGEAEASLKQSVLFDMAKQVLGKKRWQAASSILSSYMLLENEPVLTVMPHAIVID